jgi:VWFA-related protein
MTSRSRASRIVLSLPYLILAFIAFSALPGMHAQTSSLEPLKQERITLDVLASDKLGHPVPGLQQSDFTVIDNSQQRQLLDFRAINVTATPAAASVLLVVDMINATEDVIAREREQIGEFLNQDGGKLAHPTILAAMTENGVRLLPGYSQDGHLLFDNFQKIKTELRPIGQSADTAGAQERMQVSLTELDQIAAFELGQPGRKLVLIISPGWPTLFNGPSVDPTGKRPAGRGPKNSIDTISAGVDISDKQRAWVFNAIVEISDALRQAHVALYSLDPYDLGYINPFNYQDYLKGVKKPNQADFPYIALQVFAEHSGGRALTAAKGILAEINTAVRDGGSYYELTFEAPAADHPNEYHDLRVQANKPDVSVRTDASYYAQPLQIGGKSAPGATP